MPEAVGGVGAMGEVGIIHIDVAQPGQSRREGVIVFSPREADVLEEGHVTRLHVADDRARTSPITLCGKTPPHARSRCANDPRRSEENPFSLRWPGRNAMRMTFAPRSRRKLTRIRACACRLMDVAVLFFDGHIEIHPQEDTLALNIKVTN